MITQALGEIDYEEPDTYQKCEKLDVAYWVFSLLLVGLAGVFLGEVIGSSSVAAQLKSTIALNT